MRLWTNKKLWAGLAGILLSLLPQAGGAAERVVRAVDMTIGRGQSAQLSIELDALGNENGLQFSLCFDKNLLTYTSAVRGTNSSGTTFLVNTNQLANGRLGVFFGLPTEQVFDVGTRRFVHVTFTAASGESSVNTAVSLCDLPLVREISDVNGDVVTASYANAVVSIVGSCSYSLATNAAAHAQSGGDGVIALTASDSGCAWTVVNTNSWITIPSGGVGTSNVTYSVTANPDLSPRSGVIVIAGQSFTVTQAGLSCTHALSPTTRSHGYGAATNTVALTTGEGCAWNIINTNDWITFTTASSGTGSATNTYTVAANSSLVGRTGVVQIADQLFTVTQLPFVCSYSLSPRSRSHGPGAATNSVNVTTTAGCAWTATTTNPWVTILAGGSGSGNGTVSYAVAANPIALERIGSIMIADQALVLTQRAATCSQTLAPASASHGTNAGSGSFTVTTPTGCPWTVNALDTWITITSATSGDGNGSITYSIEANSSGVARSGVIAIAGSVSTNNFIVNQMGGACAYSLSTSSASHNSGAGSGSVSVTTLAGCAWSVLNTNGWVTITSVANNTGNGTVSYTIAANSEMTSRSATILIAGIPFTVNQAGFACAYTISPQNRTHGPGAATNTVSLTTSNGCSWMLVNTNPWINFLTAASGTGSMTHTYSVSANPNPAWRTGVVQIADRLLTISQQPVVCSFSLSPRSRSHGPSAASNSVTVTTSAGCTWEASTTNNWINFLTATNGLGSGSLSYAVAENSDVFERVGAIVISGQSLVLTQRAGNCSYVLAPASASHGAAAGTGSINVTAPTGCAWSVSSTNTWISITSGTSGNGNGSVQYALTANPAGNARSGSIAIDGQNFAITQAGQACSYTLSSSTNTHGGGAENGTVSVTTLAGCAWTVSNTNTWITISSSTNQTGSDTVAYTLASNPEMSPRSAVLLIAGQQFTLVQGGFVCPYTISPQTRTHGSGAATNTVSLTTSNGCSWTIFNSNAWITFTTPASGTGSATHGYTIAANPLPAWRTGVVHIADRLFTISQQPASCSYSLSPKSRTHGSGAATNSVTVTTTAGCPWAASTTNNWINLLSDASGTGAGSVSYAVTANPDIFERIGAIMIGGQSLVLTQRAATCTLSVSPSVVSHGEDVATGTFDVSAAAGCPWTASTTDSWITITSATNGSGNGSVSYAISANSTANSRSGTVRVEGAYSANFRINQAGQACAFALSATNSSHNGGTSTGSVTVTTLAGCAWTVLNTNTWITINSGTNQTGSDTVAYTLAGNPEMTSRSGTLFVAGQPFTVTQGGLQCAYSLSPQTRTHGPGTATNTVSLTTSNGCDWSLVNTNGWITFTTASTGSGSAVHTYVVAANPNPAWRTGVVQIADQLFTLQQQPAVCSVSLSPRSRSHGPGTATNTVSVATLSGCSWTANSTNSWINLLSVTNGLGNGSVTYSVSENPEVIERIGAILIADQTLVLTQRAASCTFALAPASANHGADAGTGSISITTPGGCAWTVENTNAWVTITSAASGNGSGTVNYSIAANLAEGPRTGNLLIGGELLPITQAGTAIDCTWRISPTNRVHGSGAATNSITLTASNACAWSVVNTNGWITITSSTSGSGSANISYTVVPNSGVQSRTGTVAIADQFLTLIQQGVPCEFSISPTNRTHGFSAATNSIALTAPAGCAWTISNTNTWINITSPLTGDGNASVTYTVTGNPEMTPRSGVVTIAGQPFTLTQNGLTCSYALSPSSPTHGSGAATNAFTLTTSNGCPWTVSNTNDWITITTPSSGTGSVTHAYVIAANPLPAWRTGTVQIADQVFTIYQRPVVCSISLSPRSRSHGPGAATNSVSVTAVTGCLWDASTANDWINFLSSTSGSGAGTVTYSITANPDAFERIGAIMVGQETLVLTQRAATCTYALTPTSANYGTNPSTGSIAITAPGGCAWNVTNTNSWVMITSATSGSGSGMVSYAVAANTAADGRTGNIVIADEIFAVNQAGTSLACTWRISPTNRMHGSGAATNSITLTTSNGCAWTVVNTNGWISITSPTTGSGSASISYVVEANSSIQSRTGNVLIADQMLTLVQQGVPCEFSISPTNRTHGYTPATNSIALTAPAECAWTIANSNDWIAITSPLAGAGSATVSYTVDANTVPLQRTGTVLIADQLFTLVQRAAPCLYELTPTNRLHGASSATGLVSITTSPTCDWTVENTNAWISITTGASGTGNGSIGYAVEANPTGSPRAGHLWIGGEKFTVNQSGATCSYTIAPASRAHGAGMETGSVAVTSLAGCSWSMVNTNDWINILGGTNGSGSQTRNYTVEPNPSLSPRSGSFIIAGEVFTVSQQGFTCAYRLSPTNRTHGPGPATNTVSLTTSNGCDWVVLNTNGWITISSPLNGSGSSVVSYTVEENMAPTERSGTVVIGGQVFLLTQRAADCDVTISPTNRSHGYGAATGSVMVTTLAGCTWPVVNTNDWIFIMSATNGSGSNMLSYSVAPNPSMMERTGMVMIADQMLTIRQQPAPCTYALSTSSRTHGHSAATNSVSLTSPAGCAWTVLNTNDWITITSAANGTGDATIFYMVAANPVTFSRTGSVMIAGEELVLRQLAAPCAFALSPTNASHGAVASTGMVAIATSSNCPWLVENTNAWITVTTAGSGTGNGSFGYAVASATGYLARSGFLRIGNENFKVTQSGLPCEYALSATTASHGAGMETNSVTITAGAGCAWTVSDTNSWISVLAGSNGLGNGVFIYSVDANPTILSRTAVVQVAGMDYTVSQQGAPCTYRLSPTNRSHGFGAATGTVSITALAGCPWNVVNPNEWITVTSAANGSGDGSFSYSVAANTSLTARTGLVQIADQTLSLVQQGAVCTFTVSPTNRTHGNGTVTNSIAVTTLAGCGWTAVNTNGWISFLTPTNVTGSGSISYAVETNQSLFWRTGHMVIADRVVTLLQRPTPCSFALSTSNALHGAGNETGFIAVSAPAGCPWTISNTNNWITIASDTNGSGNGSFSYEVAANPLTTSRTGAVMVADQVLTIAQEGGTCSYALSASSRSHGHGAETNSLSVSAGVGCNWTVNNANGWITILSGASASGNGVMTYALAANPASVGRTGIVDVAGLSFTVTQMAAPCTFAVSPSAWVHRAGAESGSVNVFTPAGCNWVVGNSNSWITITSPTSGSGNGVVSYTVSANTGVSDRLGVMTIAGQSFAVSQLGSGCTYRLSPTNRFHGSSATTNTVSVTASNACSWTVIPSHSWITILSNASGSGSATVRYSIAANPSATQRATVINIGGEYLTITQWGTNCGLALTPAMRGHGSGSETGLVNISTSNSNCTWAVVNTNSWLTVNTPISGSGNSGLGYTVTANNTFLPRAGAITVNGETFSISQAGLPCTYTLSATNRTHGAGSESATLAVTAGTGCPWTVENTNAWITITSGSSGSGNGTIHYNIDPNPAGLPRSGTVIIAGRNLLITQSPAPCTYALAPASRNHGAGAQTGLVTVTTLAGCPWFATHTNAWITLTTPTNGIGNGSIGYALAPNPSSVPRSGAITIDGQSLTLTQDGAACALSILPIRRDHGAGAETGLVSVTTPAGCPWTVSNTNNWITITSATNGSGNASVSYTLAANGSFASRTGLVHIAGQTLTLTQPGANCDFTLVPAARAHGSGSETGLVGVATSAGCVWEVLNTHAWITLTTSGGTGSGSFAYTLAANPETTPRTATLSIGARTFTLTQAGLVCSYALAPAGRSHGTNAGSGTVGVTTSAGCAWNVVNTNTWITIDSGGSGSGNGTLTYSVSANSGPPRSGNLDVNGQVFAVNQTSALRLVRALPMTVTLGQTNTLIVALDAGGDENGVGFSLCYNTNVLTYVRAVRGNEAVNAGATLNVNNGSTNRGRLGLAIALTADQAFPAGSNSIVEISFRTAAQATPGATVVSLCDLPIAREVANVLADPVPASYVDAPVTVMGACNYTLGAASAAFDENGGGASVNLTAGAGCPWTVENSNSWITITSGANGSGNAAVQFNVSPNPNTAPRTGAITIAGQLFTITQAATPCAYVLVPTTQDHTSAAESGSISLTTLSGCPWAVVNTNTWITLSSLNSELGTRNAEPWTASGNGSLNYNVALNPTSTGRTGHLTIAGQTIVIRQAGMPCFFAINPTSRAHGTGTETGLVTVTATAGCPWTAESAASWITVTSGLSGSGNGTLGYRALSNPNLIARTGTVLIAGQTYTLTQPGNPCAVTLSPTNFDLMAGNATGQVAVTAASGCAWNVSNTNTWITITTSTNGTANGTVRFTAASNPSGAPRTAIVTVSGQAITINQLGAACVYAIAPSTRAHPYTADTNSVSVATFPGCPWTVFTSNNWITITSPINLTGGGAVNYTIGPNPSGFSRTGLVMIAGQPFTVTQAGAPCAYVVSPASRHHGFGIESNTFTLATVFGCPWAVINTNPWVRIASETNGTGPWGVSYVVTNNPTGLARTGIVMIAGQPVTLSQAAAPCTYALSTTNRVHGHGAATNTINVTTLLGCNWSAANTNPWITLLTLNSERGTRNAEPWDATGSGTLTYAVEQNPTSIARTATVAIAGATLTLTQLGAPCTYALTPTNRAHGYTATTNTVTLDSVPGCTWTATTTNPWITLLILNSERGTRDAEPWDATGDGTLTYAIADNPAAYSRTGHVTLGGQTLALTQAGAPCMFTFAPESPLHTASAQTGLVTIVTAVGCPWTLANTNPWITITTPTNGLGSGLFTYLLATNPLPTIRTGTVTIAGQPYSIAQEGFTCTYTLAPTSGNLTAGNVTGLVSVTTSPLCSWAVVNTNPWISIKAGASGTGPGLVRYTAAANPNPSIRSGTMLIGEVPFTVTQLGSPCSYSLSPSNRLHGSGLETNTINLLTVGECTWTIQNTNPWITVLTPTNGAGNALIQYFVEPNPAALDRTGRVQIAGLTFPVTQLGAACLYTLTPPARELDFMAQTGSITVAATLGCSWNVVNTNAWLTLTSGTRGTNAGIINYTVAANYTPGLRTATLTIGNQPFTLTQTGIVCAFIVAPTNRAHGYTAEPGAIIVTTSNLCPWTAANTNTWITILTPTNNAGDGTLNYTLTANPSPFPRTGTFTVAGQTVTVTQAGFLCQYTLTPAARTHGFGAVTGLVSVATSNQCSWTLSSTQSWITFLGNTNRTNGGFVSYVLAMNPAISARTGVVTIAGQPFTLTQYGVPFAAAPNKTLECGTPWTFDPPVPTGTCGESNHTLTILSTTTNSGCGSAYSATRRWDALDACSNRMTLTQTVSVVVTAPPLLACAPTKTVECGTAWTFDMPTATDACGNTNVTVAIVSTVTLPGGGCGGSYTTIRQWQATDGCTNRAMCSQTVLVVDRTPPTLICAPNKSAQCGSAWSFDSPTAFDSCSTNVTIQVLSTVTNAAGPCAGTYSVTRSWEASDACSNRTSCSQTITLIDSTAPLLSCPANKTVECALAWSFDPPVAVDGCGGSNVTLRVFTTVTNAGACAGSYTASRTWEALDGCGNRGTCSQTVSVIDMTPPSLSCPATKSVEFGTAWSFDSPVASDSCGGSVTLRVVSTVTNSAGFCGSSYGVTRTWEALDACSNRSASCSQWVRVVDTTPPVLSCAGNKMVTCGAGWAFDAPTALDAVDGTNVTITVVSTVTNGTCASGFSAVRVWRASDVCGNLSALCSQTVSAISQASVDGTISYHPTNYPAAAPTAKRLSPVPVHVTGGTNMTNLTVADGSYSATLAAGGGYTFTPRLTNSSPAANGVSTLDISLIRRHILNIASLDSPYKLLAGDVNGSRSVTTLDISLIRRLILGMTNNLPAGLWRFVPSDHVFADPLNPWDGPTNRNYPSLVASVSGQDFMAIKLGDVNNSWAPPVSQSGFAPAADNTAHLASAPVVTFAVSSHTNQPGDWVAAQVTAAGFREVTSAQWTLAWDPAVLRYVGIGNYGLKGLGAGNFGTDLTGSGRLTFSWDDPDALGVSVADGTTVCAVDFEVVGSAGSASPLWLAGFVTEAEVGVKFNEANLRAVSGEVSVLGTGGVLPAQPQLARPVFTNGVFGVPQQTVAGRRYTLEYTDSLPTTNWTALPTVTGDGSVVILSDPGATSRQRFYRLRIE